MSILHESKFIPSVQTTDEKRIYFYAISHIPIDAQITPADDVTLTPEEHQKLTKPPSPDRPGAPRVTSSSTNHPLPPSRSLIDPKAPMGVNPATAEALMDWKTIRFFSELFRVMIEGVGAEADPVAYAHRRLMQNRNTKMGVAKCARSLPLAMVRRAVEDLLLRRRGVLRRRALAEAEEEMYETRRGSEPGMLETEKLVRQWDSVVFYRRMDQYLELEDIRNSLLCEMARA